MKIYSPQQNWATKQCEGNKLIRICESNLCNFSKVLAENCNPEYNSLLLYIVLQIFHLWWNQLHTKAWNKHTKGQLQKTNMQENIDMSYVTSTPKANIPGQQEHSFGLHEASFQRNAKQTALKPLQRNIRNLFEHKGFKRNGWRF